ncbi:MAG TPA: TrkH family potassium uptake protein [bacterium]
MLQLRTNLSTARIVAGSFLIAIGIGTALLMIPPASRGEPLAFLDAVFMSTSAVCVTGLSVMDIGTVLTPFGQGVILFLIQAGGLGIMTFSVFFLMLLGRQVSLGSRMSVGLDPQKHRTRTMVSVLGMVLALTLVVEAVGAALLYPRLLQLHPAKTALFSAVFHAVSAFCNSGFSLYPDSMVRFQDEWFVPLVVMILVVLGGLGFMVLDELLTRRPAGWRALREKLSVHTRVCLIGSALLLVTGALVLWLFERSHQLSGMPAWQQAVNAVFLSATARTAGFNTLDTASLTNASLYFLMVLMFIGGCPGSTAGGIKITTLAVLLALIKDQIRGRVTTSIFHRQIPRATVARSLAIFSAGLVMITAAAMLLQITESPGGGLRLDRGAFLELFFEATSAAGTVGLSTGTTASLSAAGKLLVIVLMYVGRIGPLTLGLALVARRKSDPRFEFIEEDVMVG